MNTLPSSIVHIIFLSNFNIKVENRLDSGRWTQGPHRRDNYIEALKTLPLKGIRYLLKYHHLHLLTYFRKQMFGKIAILIGNIPGKVR